MIARLPHTPEQRVRRKADLLLASELVRRQADLCVDDIGGRADRVALRAIAVFTWLSDPLVLAVAGSGVTYVAMVNPRQRGRLLRGAQWAWTTWRNWRN